MVLFNLSGCLLMMGLLSHGSFNVAAGFSLRKLKLAATLNQR
jgi:hypothetical protein